MEQHDWKDAETIEPPSDTTFNDGIDVYWTRTIASAQMGDTNKAQKAFDDFSKSAQVIGRRASWIAEILQLEKLQAEGWLLHSQHRDEAAVKTLREAVQFERAHPMYYPDVLARPSEEFLGDLFMELHQPKQALHAYQAALSMAPNRFDSLYGAFRSSLMISDNFNEQQYALQMLAQCPKVSNRKEFVQVVNWIETRRSDGHMKNARKIIAGK